MKNENIYKAISDKNRIRIITLLIKGPLKVTDIATKLDLEENLTSHHLRVLHTLKFLKSNRRGREVIYQVNASKFTSVFRDLFRIELFRTIAKDLLKKNS